MTITAHPATAEVTVKVTLADPTDAPALVALDTGLGNVIVTALGTHFATPGTPDVTEVSVATVVSGGVTAEGPGDIFPEP